MNNDKRFLVKMLGVFNMQADNFTAKQVNETLWTIAKIGVLMILAANLPELITAIRWW